MTQFRGLAASLLVLFALVQGSNAQGPAPASQKVLIKAAKPYAALVAQIEARGGAVTHQFTYWDGIAAELPLGALGAVTALAGGDAVSRDEIIPLPMLADQRVDRLGTGADVEATADSLEVLGEAEIQSLAEVTPQAYLLNNAIAQASPLHAAGITGSGIVVAVIDSGLRPQFPHIAAGVVGCDNFVPSGTCSAAANNSHGTTVAGMVRSNVLVGLPAGSALLTAIAAECPSCLVSPTQVAMVGTAPLSSIYAMRVFPTTGGAQTSWVLAAMERAIELRERHDAGQPGGANVRVVNLSLGGPSVHAGRDMFDLAVAALIDHDIVPVIASGNAGPSSLTLGSPGSAIGALTVGAASLPHNERILRRAQFGAAVGAAYRPFMAPQMAYFSSRGPNPDGRLSPHVVASGFASFGISGGTPAGVTLASGTSFAAPSVAGVAALLAQAFPAATARQIRNAIIASANPGILADGSTVVDQGAGYVDALAAANLLATGTVPDALEAHPTFNKNVKTNVARTTPLIVREGIVAESVPALLPGQRHDVLYDVPPNTRQVLVSLTNVTPSLPPAQQNQLFGDDILLAIHSAKTSSIGEGDYRHFAFTTGGTFVVNEPEPGLMRITVSGDWTNAGAVAADVSITPLLASLPQMTRQGRITQGELIALPIQVPAGVSEAAFRLQWREDWGRYPAGNLDLFLIRPNGTVVSSGATLNNPERVTIANPAAGTWTAIVSGFELHTLDDRYDLRVTLDGKVVR